MSNQNMVNLYSEMLFTIKMDTKQHGGNSKTLIHEISQTQTCHSTYVGIMKRNEFSRNSRSVVAGLG